MHELSKRYKHETIEAKWQQHWQNACTYTWKGDGVPRDQCYVIDTPPPTVSGVLHMGHMFSYTQIDFIARYQRMKGKEVFFQIGFDDNGLPTERLTEKTYKVKSSQMDRQEFIDLCYKTVAGAEAQFRDVYASMGISHDSALEYRTILPNAQKLSQMSFVDMYNKDYVYRSIQPTLWDVVDQTALSQADVVDKELPGEMFDLVFAITGGNSAKIATTRPEYLPACVAVLCHPDDRRYLDLHGKKLITPLFNMEVPVITDKDVIQDKGTGLVMCCTFGDVMDIKWQQKYKLPIKPLITHHGHVDISKLDIDYSNNNIIKAINGLYLKKARDIIVAELYKQNKILNKQDIVHSVKCAERSGAALEILVAPQWCVRVSDHKEKIRQLSTKCKWWPAHMSRKLDDWIDGISWDWCISRQRSFGVQFPVWYSKRAGEEGKVLIADTNQLPVDPFKDLPQGYSRDEVIPDSDVMDTWATSALTPQLNSQGITDSLAIDQSRHNKLFPADLRAQAHEIIRTWTFYTISKSYFHQNTHPWHNIMISGWCLAPDGSKMSKSKGNVITPESMIRQRGADIIRYWIATSKLGTDTSYSDPLLDTGKKVVNKLWNAAKFCSLHFANIEGSFKNLDDAINQGVIYCDLDHWLIAERDKVIKQVDNHFAHYEYSFAKQAVDDFFRSTICDDYLEIIKTRIYNDEDSKAQQSSIHTLYHVFYDVVRMFSPFMPHVTEEIYHSIFENDDNISIHRKGNWPLMCANNAQSGSKYLETGEVVGEILSLVRKAKTDNQFAMNHIIQTLHVKIIKLDFAILSDNVMQDLKNVTRAENIIIETDDVWRGKHNTLSCLGSLVEIGIEF